MPKLQSVSPELQLALSRFLSFSKDLNLIFSHFSEANPLPSLSKKLPRKKPTPRSVAWREQRQATTAPAAAASPALPFSPPPGRREVLRYLIERTNERWSNCTTSVSTSVKSDRVLLMDEERNEFEGENEEGSLEDEGSEKSEQADSTYPSDYDWDSHHAHLTDYVQQLADRGLEYDEAHICRCDHCIWNHKAARNNHTPSGLSRDDSSLSESHNHDDFVSDNSNNYVTDDNTDSSSDPDYLPSDDTFDGSSSDCSSNPSDAVTSEFSSEGDYDSENPYDDHHAADQSFDFDNDQSDLSTDLSHISDHPSSPEDPLDYTDDSDISSSNYSASEHSIEDSTRAASSTSDQTSNSDQSNRPCSFDSDPQYQSNWASDDNKNTWSGDGCDSERSLSNHASDRKSRSNCSSHNSNQFLQTPSESAETDILADIYFFFFHTFLSFFILILEIFLLISAWKNLYFQ